MKWKIYYFILIFYCPFFQGIGTSEENRKSSNVHLRKKRLVDRTPNGNRPVPIQQVPYIVNIQGDGSTVCGGSILSPTNILTAAHCFRNTEKKYRILSGSNFRNRGIPHNIIMKIIHPQYFFHLNPYDLALLVISPPIDLYRSRNRRIRLFSGNLPPNASGIFSGWGCNRIIFGIECYPRELRSATLPIISQQECQSYYRNHSTILNTDICTLDKTGQRGACFTDSGGPFVFNNQLIGVLSWTKSVLNPESPDVFMNVVHHEYRNWIISNIQHVY